MIFRERVRGRVAMRGNALRASDIDESIVANAMGFFGDATNGFELLFGMKKTFVAAGDIVVDFNAEDTTAAGFLGDFGGIVGLQPVGADTGIVAPVLAWRVGLGMADDADRQQDCRKCVSRCA